MATPKAFIAITNEVVPARQNGPATLNFVEIFNPSDGIAYLQLFDVKNAQDVILGTTVPTLVFGCVGSDNPSPEAGQRNLPIPGGAAFVNGLFAAMTTEPVGDDAPSDDCIVNLVFG